MMLIGRGVVSGTVGAQGRIMTRPPWRPILSADRSLALILAMVDAQLIGLAMIVGGIAALVLMLYVQWRAARKAREGAYPPAPTAEQIAAERHAVAEAAADVGAADDEVTGLFLYPIKSCAQVPVQAATFDARGFRNDRRWMVVNASGRFQSQRVLPRMCLITPVLRCATAGDLSTRAVSVELTAPGVGPLVVPVVTAAAAAAKHGKGKGGACVYACSVWSSAVHGAVDQGAAAAAWLDAFLGTTGLRLVYMDPAHTRRAAPAKFIARSPHAFVQRGASATASFADGFPFLLTSEESLADLNARIAARHDGDADAAPLPMRRFRPNIMVRRRGGGGGGGSGGGGSGWREDGWAELAIGQKGRLFRFFGVKKCSRCKLTTNNPDTGELGGDLAEPLATLRTFRVDGKDGVYFGQNLAPARVPATGTLRVGDGVRVLRDVGATPV